ncbi:sarcosine oxidase/sarcosine oxidase subunit beta [Devosia sp. YR412]|uniref:NAD(P)/FAD-dependent oxidoreductase n=1 Tax=Devosia sp. YR412 TaxID=1881030 RepID=UPI0008C941A9|nr:FAD-dependent oxidoreductase [Devosia sp. YR412]SEP67143.1 sarcosine oxidase/sarcosine oxidase subunit beta [Devosia sp. YR412]
MRVSIVGAGIAGLSLAWALRKRGVDVSLFDTGTIPNPGSSSFDEHRITRHSYGHLPGYGALMPQAFATYDQLWADIGATHYMPTNMVFVARENTDWSASAAELDRVGVSHRIISPAEVATRLPMLHADGVSSAFEAGGAGMLFANRIVTDLARWVAEHGVSLHPQTRVEDIDAAKGSLTAGGVRHDADLVVVAAGAWVPELLPATKTRMVPSRQLLLYLEPPADLTKAWSGAPVLVDSGGGHGAYILPPRGGTRLKIGDHIFTRRGQGSDDRIATEADVAPVLESAAAIFARFDEYKILERKVCYYTVTDDEGFVVEPIGPAGWVLSACSGHGFKLGPLIASGLADAIIGKRPAETLPAWAAGRVPLVPPAPAH